MAKRAKANAGLTAIISDPGILICALTHISSLPAAIHSRTIGTPLSHLPYRKHGSQNTPFYVLINSSARRRLRRRIAVRLGSGFVAPMVFGAALDPGGGHVQPSAWSVAVGTLGLGRQIRTLVMHGKLQLNQ